MTEPPSEKAKELVEALGRARGSETRFPEAKAALLTYIAALEEAEARVEELEREMNAVEVMTRDVFFLPWWLRRVGPRCHEIARRALREE